MCARVCLQEIVTYGCFASGYVQEWAKDETDIYFDKTVNVDKHLCQTILNYKVMNRARKF